MSRPDPSHSPSPGEPAGLGAPWQELGSLFEPIVHYGEDGQRPAFQNQETHRAGERQCPLAEPVGTLVIALREVGQGKAQERLTADER